jgi:hypothetical protein
MIGYLGAEVAQETLFERLLWPQRYYNDFSPRVLLQMAVLMPMGGPLHRAALATLDLFREKGLYLGQTRGNMLGTAFMRDIDVGYYARTTPGERESRGEARNGFWIDVLRRVQEESAGRAAATAAPAKDMEADPNGSRRRRPHRATQKFCHLKLRQVDGEAFKKIAGVSGSVSVSEETFAWRCWAGIFSSELSAVTVALVAGIYMRCIWLAVYFCVPLLFKLFSVFISVRREPISPIPQPEKEVEGEPESSDSNDDADAAIPRSPLTSLVKKEASQQESYTLSEIYEIDDLDHGFFLIEGPPAVVLQFFRHYGHPMRENNALFGDRARELTAMALCYSFVLYFPAGLLALLWEDSQVQYLWLGYQVYTILAMHFVRLFGWGDCGMTQVRCAHLLQRGKEVWLRSSNDSAVGAVLAISQASSVSEGTQRVKHIMNMHAELRKRN